MSLNPWQLQSLARKVPEDRLASTSNSFTDTDPVHSKTTSTSGSSWSSNGEHLFQSLPTPNQTAPTTPATSSFDDASRIARFSHRTKLARRPEDKACQASGIPRVEHWNAPIEGEEGNFPQTVPGTPISEVPANLFFKQRSSPTRKSSRGNRSAEAATDYFGFKEVAVQLPTANDDAIMEDAASVDSDSTTRPVEAGTKRAASTILPQPVETTRRSQKGRPPPAQRPQCEGLFRLPSPEEEKPEPKMFTLPQPVETTRRSNKPLARPLIPNVMPWEFRRSNRSKTPAMALDLSEKPLPKPISTSRWTNKAMQQGRQLRRNSTAKPMASPNLYYFVPKTGEKVAKNAQGEWVDPEEQVSHWSEPIDSMPPSPSEGMSPSSSACPSLSSSPTNSTTSLGSLPVKSRKFGIEGRRESMEDGFGTYISEVQRSKMAKSKLKEHVEVQALGRDATTNTETETVRGRELQRKDRDDTLRQADDRTIYASPIRTNMVRPKEIDVDDLQQQARFGVLLPSVRMHQSKPAVGPMKGVENKILSTKDLLQSHTITPSPGITVASLPPRKPANPSANPEEEVTDDFVKSVYQYLSLNIPLIACKFDDEISSTTGIPVDRVKQDRMSALREYIKGWMRENPVFEGNESQKGGLW